MRRAPARALLAALLAIATLLAPIHARPGPAATFLEGELLVATEALDDPRFARTVVYLARHDADGALGVIVNRPIGEMPLRDLLARFGLDPTQAAGTIQVHYGGPVAPRQGLVLHTRDDQAGGGGPGPALYALTPDPAILRAMAAGTGPRRALLAAGHAGWAPGQLEREIENGYWFTVPADEALVFDGDAATKWERARARRKINI